VRHSREKKHTVEPIQGAVDYEDHPQQPGKKGKGKCRGLPTAYDVRGKHWVLKLEVTRGFKEKHKKENLWSVTNAIFFRPWTKNSNWWTR